MVMSNKAKFTKKLLMMRNGTPPDVGPPSTAVRMGSDHPDLTMDTFWHPVWTNYSSPPEWNRTPGMLLGSIQGLWWPSSSSATMRTHP